METQRMPRKGLKRCVNGTFSSQNQDGTDVTRLCIYLHLVGHRLPRVCFLSPVAALPVTEGALHLGPLRPSSDRPSPGHVVPEQLLLMAGSESPAGAQGSAGTVPPIPRLLVGKRARAWVWLRQHMTEEHAGTSASRTLGPTRPRNPL